MNATLESALQLTTAIASNGSTRDLALAAILQTVLDAARAGQTPQLARHIADWHLRADAATAAVGVEKPLRTFEKDYDGESVCDVSRDVMESFDERFNPDVAAIPSDEYGFAKGVFTVSIDWKMEGR